MDVMVFVIWRDYCEDPGVGCEVKILAKNTYNNKKKQIPKYDFLLYHL